MTLKEKLTAKANLIELGSLDEIEKNIKYIALQMEEFASKRSYTISLVVPHETWAIGGANTNYASFFVPRKMDPEHYRSMYVEELRKLGFEKFELSKSSTHGADYYTIRVEW